MTRRSTALKCAGPSTREADVVDAHTVTGYALFASPIGVCGIAWNDVGVAGIQLPDVRKTETRARMRERFPAAREVAPPPHAQQAVEAIVGMLDGDGNDLRDVALDMADIAPF